MANTFPQLPATGFLRLSQIIGNSKTKPPINPIYPVSKSTWWTGVKLGRFPKPVKLGPRITAWRVEDIRDLIQQDSEWTERETTANKAKDHPDSHQETPKIPDSLSNKY